MAKPSKKFVPFKKKCEGEECEPDNKKKPMKEGSIDGIDGPMGSPMGPSDFDDPMDDDMGDESDPELALLNTSPYLDDDLDSPLDNEIDSGINPLDSPDDFGPSPVNPMGGVQGDIQGDSLDSLDSLDLSVREPGEEEVESARIAQNDQKQPIWRTNMEQRNREKAIVESISNFLRDKASLGLPGKKDSKEVQNIAQERVEGLYETFALKFVDSPFYESVTRAFRKIHSYKYLDHPTFKLSLESEMKCTGVPIKEIEKVLTTVDSLVEEFGKNPGERDSGWNEDRLKDVLDMTRNADRRKPKHEDPFNTPMGD